MVFKGSTLRSAEDIARSVDSIGGNLDAFTAKELVSFNTKVLDDHLALAFDVLSDLVLHPVFRPEDIEKEKGVILEELKMDADNPEYLVHEIFSANFWKDHPLGKPILGTRETVRRFNRDMVGRYWGAHYVPANFTITAAGNLRHTDLVRLVEERFQELPAVPDAPPDGKPVTHARISVRQKKSLEQVHICLGVPSYPLSHEDRFACYVLNTVLGGGMSSRLFQNIRERQGLAYAVFSELNAYRDTRRLKDSPVEDEELRRAKDYIKGSLMLGLESTSSRMVNLARQEIYFGRFITMDELLESVERVTVADVQRIAQTFFETRQIALTVLGNLDGFHISREDVVC
jgi:predicted Zn-dependent peptidase